MDDLNTNSTATHFGYCAKCGRLITSSYYMLGDYKYCNECWEGGDPAYITIPDIKRFGWECPRCHLVHAPNSLTCDCRRSQVFYTK